MKRLTHPVIADLTIDAADADIKDWLEAGWLEADTKKAPDADAEAKKPPTNS